MSVQLSGKTQTRKFDVLRAIDAGHQRQADIARAANMIQSHVSVYIRQLIHDGVLERVPTGWRRRRE